MIFSSKIQNLPIQLEKISKKHLQKMEKDNIIWIVKNLQILTVGGRKLKEKITILIADDNIDFTRTLSAYLEKMEDIEVVGIAKDGNEAFEIIKGTHPDILLLDVIMPHLDGIGVLEKLNETTMTKKPITIMLSASRSR